MFCSNCGKSIPDGSVFCPECGTPMSVAARQAQPSVSQEPQKKGAAGFFTSPGGIAFTILISLLVVAGIVVGIIFAVRAGSGNGFEDEIAKAWEEYEDTVDGADRELAQIDLSSADLSADLERYQEELDATRKKVQALEDVLRDMDPPDNTWKKKYSQLVGSIKYYNRYIEKLSELYTTLAVGDMVSQVNTIQAILDDLQDLASEAKDLANDFLADNDAVTGGKFDPGIFDLPTDVADQVTAIIGGEIIVDDGATDGDNSTDIAAASAVMEEILSLYRGGGWQAISGYMAPELYDAFINAPVSWDQVSYVVTGTTILSETMTDANTIYFNVEQTLDDFGDISAETGDWQMVRSGSTWRLYNYVNQYGESKL